VLIFLQNNSQWPRRHSLAAGGYLVYYKVPVPTYYQSSCLVFYIVLFVYNISSDWDDPFNAGVAYSCLSHSWHLDLAVEYRPCL
jgi:hypothetical protein